MAAEHRSETSWDFLSGNLDRDRRNLHLLMDTAEELYGVLDREERKRRAVDRAVLVTGAETGFLLTPRDGRLAPNVVRGVGGAELPPNEPYSASQVRRVWETGDAIRGPTLENLDPTRSIVDAQIQSMMATRLHFEGRPVGVLYVHAQQAQKDFSETDFQAFLALGGLIATALVNARLADEAVARAELEKHLERAREVQRRLQPESVSMPAGFDVAGVGRVCEELSGDYYDVVELPDGRIAVAIGDVCGKGIRAALYGTTARALFRSHVRAGHGPGETLDAIGRFLGEDMDDWEFMTFFLGIVDPGRRTLTWAGAGHNPPLLRDASGGIRELASTGRPLGMEPIEAYDRAGPVPFAAGDLLFLYTDGITEAMDARRRQWGEERLREALHRLGGAGRAPRDVLADVLAEVDAFRGGCPLEDDITCLVVRAL